MLSSVSPVDPADIVAEFDEATAEDVAGAVRRSGIAQRTWSAESALVRSRALDGLAGEVEAASGDLGALVVREVGKPIGEVRLEMARAAAILRYYAQLALGPEGEAYPPADRRSLLVATRRPLGVAGLITPWNFPVAIPIWKAAPALAFGNTVVLKPAPQATAVALRLAELARPHLPADAFQVVPGGAAAGEALISDPGVAVVSFTGSTAVGRRVAAAAAARGARFQCEMGGHNPAIVLADADLELAVPKIAYSAMGYAGQKCTATRRVIVEERVYGEVRDRLVAAVEQLEMVDVWSDDCVGGPLIEESAREGAVSALRQSAGELLTGGGPLNGRGFFFAPTLLELDDPGDVLACQEVFAPVASLFRVPSADAALELANGTVYGLTAAVYTRNLDRALEFASRLETGVVRVNAPTTGVDFHAPFGGSKESGVGPREQGTAARDFFTETTTALISPMS